MKKDDYDKETMKKAEEVAESYLKNNYQDIESIEIEEVYRSQMGGMTVDGTVNNTAGFSIGIEESDFTIRGIAEKKGFPEEKEDCKEKDCDY